MPNIAIGGAIKKFTRAIGANATYAPDAATIGTRSNEAGGDVSVNGINTQLDNVVQASGEGWIVPTNKNVFVVFTGWTNAVCVIQAYIDIGSIGWITIQTFATPMVAQNLNFSCPYPIRIGALTIGADAATLKLVVGYNDDNLNV